MIQSYKKSPALAEKYDHIIIGSGIGSLTVAALLSKEGKKVLVLERHYTAGGFTHVFKRKDYEWDVGIHYLGDMERENSPLKRIFDYITDGNLKWADMGEVYERIIIGDREYEFVKGIKNWKRKMFDYFPSEKEAIEKYVNLVFESNRAMGKFHAEKALPGLWRTFAGGFIRRPAKKFYEKTTYEVLSQLTDNQQLIKVLTGQYGDYGLPPKQSSFSMQASVARHYFNGGFFPIGGSSQIVKTIDPIIEAAGGTILISAEAEKILVEKNRAKGVRMKDGKCFFAGSVISGAGVFNTFEKLAARANFGAIRFYKTPEKSQSIRCFRLSLHRSDRLSGRIEIAEKQSLDLSR